MGHSNRIYIYHSKVNTPPSFDPVKATEIIIQYVKFRACMPQEFILRGQL